MKEPSGRDRLLELDEVERRLKPFGRRYLGVREIPLDALVGTEAASARSPATSARFSPPSRDRLRSLQEGFADGLFPPIVAVKLGETYFVIDGHHRIALARRGGADMIDADVTELVARRPAHFLELLVNIQVHGYHMMRERRRVVEIRRSPRTCTTRSTRRRSPRSTGCDSTAYTRTRRPGTCSSFSTAPAGCIPLDRLHLAQTVVSVIGDGGAAPPATVAGSRAPFAGLAVRPSTGFCPEFCVGPA
jgi:ParB-like nuclease domain